MKKPRRKLSRLSKAQRHHLDGRGRQWTHLGRRRLNLYSLGLIDGSRDVNTRDCWGRTPLICAVQRQNLPLVRSLLKLGADVHARDFDGCIALHYGLGKRHSLKIVTLILKSGADVDAFDGHEQHTLLFPVLDHNFPLIRLLLRKGADPNKVFHGSAIVGAFVHGNSRKVAWELFKAGADAKTADWDGETPLFYASYGDPKFARALLEKGADPNAADKHGVTPLMNAASRSSELVRLLLDAGARVNDSDGRGMTPLMYAAGSNAEPEAIQILINAGADVSARDKEGLTVLGHAERSPYKSSKRSPRKEDWENRVAVLRAAGATE